MRTEKPILNKHDAEKEWHPVRVQLLECIRDANTWHEVRRAADALFHARLIWESTHREILRIQGENQAAPATDQQEAP